MNDLFFFLLLSFFHIYIYFFLMPKYNKRNSRSVFLHVFVYVNATSLKC